jgi:hypothetical protein
VLDKLPKKAEALDQLKCGDCGGELFRMHHKRPNGECRVGGHGKGGFTGALVATCVNCGRTTTISATPATLTTDGFMCGGWNGR